MKKLIITVAVIAMTSPAAATMYWCKEGGKTVISDMPCKTETLQQKDMDTPEKIVEGGIKKAAPVKQPARTTYKQVQPKTQKRPVQKNRLSADDYDINHRVRERNGEVEVSGRISGPRCEALRVNVYARSEDGRIINCTDVTRLSARSTTFSCTDRERKAEDGRPKEWFISSLYVRCNE